MQQIGRLISSRGVATRGGQPVLVVKTLQHNAMMVAPRGACRMREVEVDVPTHLSSAAIRRALQDTLTGSTLRITVQGSLKTYPGCTHWHLKQATGRGPLE